MAYGGYPDRLKKAVVKAAAKYGIPDAADELIATTLVESGGRLDAIGDNGNSGGPFQENSAGRGAGIPMRERFNPERSADRAAKEYAAFVKKGYSAKGFNPELAYAAQRPADKGDYISKLNARLADARRILGGQSPSADAGNSPNAPGVDTSSAAPQPEDKLVPALDDMITNREKMSSSDRLKAAVNAMIDQDIANRAAEANAPDAAAEPVQAPAAPDGNDAPFKPGGGWGGSEGVIKSIAGPSMEANGLKVTSAKRDNKNPASGNRSDHHIGNKNAFAWDISNGSNPTPEMDAAASDIVSRLGGPKNWGKTGGNFIKQVGDYRFQVIYRSQVGGNHDDHVHVGVHRV